MVDTISPYIPSRVLSYVEINKDPKCILTDDLRLKHVSKIKLHCQRTDTASIFDITAINGIQLLFQERNRIKRDSKC